MRCGRFSRLWRGILLHKSVPFKYGRVELIVAHGFNVAIRLAFVLKSDRVSGSDRIAPRLLLGLHKHKTALLNCRLLHLLRLRLLLGLAAS